MFFQKKKQRAGAETFLSDGEEKVKGDTPAMAKDCPPNEIMDVGWDNQITIGGIKKSFHNVSPDCRDTFDQVDNLLNDAAKNTVSGL